MTSEAISASENDIGYLPNKFLSKEFCKEIQRNIEFHQKHRESLNMSIKGNEFIHSIYSDKVFYLSNLIYDKTYLNDFYKEQASNIKLLNNIAIIFDLLADWKYDYKTSPREDFNIAKKLRDKLLECSVFLCDSPDLRFNIQMFWERYLRKIMNEGYKHKSTDKGKEIKAISKRLFNGGFTNLQELKKDGYVQEDSSLEYARELDLLSLFRNLHDFLDEIAPDILNKSTTIKKIHSENAHVHYTIIKLKEVFEKHSVPKRKHIKYITDIINGVMLEEDVSEDRIRKFLSLNNKK